MKLVEKAGRHVVNSLVKRERAGWPPVCTGVIYQPERPVRENISISEGNPTKGGLGKIK